MAKLTIGRENVKGKKLKNRLDFNKKDFVKRKRLGETKSSVEAELF